jgi:hypothetical protein
MPIVASYAPELLELLKRAALEPVLVSLPTKKDATRLAFQLNMLRKAMREEGHILVAAVSPVNISVNGSTLVAKPADSNFLDAIRKAGISLVPLPHSDREATITEQDSPAPPSLGAEEGLPLALPTASAQVHGQGDEEAKAALRAFLFDEPLEPIPIAADPANSTSNESE